MSPGLVDVGPALEKICTEVVAADAASVDHDGAFPERGVRALAAAGLRGAVSAPEVGGLGLGFRGAATIVGPLAQDCGSTAMVACMHHHDEHSAPDVQRSQRGLLGGHHGERRAADGPACERRPLRASQIGYLLVKRAVRRAAPGESIEVTGHAADLHVHLRAWCRAEGHRFDWQPVPGKAHGRALVHAGAAESERWAGAHLVSGGRNLGDDMQVLAVQTADEARHIEVFTRRARLPAPGARAGIPAAPRRRLRRRHDALRHTAGLNDEVFDALLLMAAGSWDHDALRLVAERVMRLMHDMDEGRRKR